MRAFIAIDFPAALKTKLQEKETALQKYDLDANWVKPQNLHLTLKFLGEIEPGQTEEIKKIMAAAAAQFAPFTAALKNFGFFPNERRPRVFFVATDNEKKLKNISQILEENLHKLGFPKENRFKSHITLARIKSAKNIDRWQEEIKNVALEETFVINKITLFKSTLTKSGPIYEEIFSASLERK